MNYKQGYIILELHHGTLIREWNDIAECGAFHHVHPATIKELIFTGNPLPSSSDLITFDLDPECKWDVVLSTNDSNKFRKRRSYQLVKSIENAAEK